MNSTLEQGAPRAPDRGARPPQPRRTNYAKYQPPTAGGYALRREADGPALDLAGERCTHRELMREPGDEARKIIEFRHPDGRRYQCADCREYLQCDCPDGVAYGNCAHLRAAVAAELLPPVGLHWPRAPRRKKGGA